MPINLLNLDTSLSTPDVVANANTNGVVRFLDEGDVKSLAALQRLQNDLVVRDNLVQRKVNELVLALNQLSAADLTGAIGDPILATDPSNKHYVDVQDQALSRSISLLSARVNSFRATSVFLSDWTTIQWQSGAKEKFEVVLTDKAGDPVSSVDFDNTVSVTLLIRADVSSVGVANQSGTPSYVYRSVTFGQTTGFKLDDVYMISPNKVVFLIPYSSFFAVYPVEAGYYASQPSSISVKAFVTTTQIDEQEGQVPGLSLTPEELGLVVAAVMDELATTENVQFKLANADATFVPLVAKNPDGSLLATGVSANNRTIRIPAPLTAPTATMVGRNVGGELVTPDPTQEASRASATRLWLTDESGAILQSDSLPLPVFQLNVTPTIVHRTKMIDAITTDVISLDPDTLVSRPAWATRVKLRIVTACHTRGRTASTFNKCAVRVLKTSTPVSPDADDDVIASSTIEWDYGNGVRLTGLANYPYQDSDSREVWVDLVSNILDLSVQYHVGGLNNPWGVCVIHLIAYGR